MSKDDTDKAWRERKRAADRAYRRANRDRDRDASIERNRQWRADNAERASAYGRSYYEGNRGRWLLRTYGITLEQYDEMLEAQGGVCRICGGTNPEGKRLHVDHGHDSGLVRGLLCNGCNTGLGLFKENVASLAAAIVYLEEYREQVE